MASETSPEFEFVNTPLYGGAITVDLPSTYGDVSQIRQVPDHQEIYFDRAGYSSIIIEITERVDRHLAPTDADALRYHFDDLIDAPGGTSVRAAGGEETLLYRPASARLARMPQTPTLTLISLRQPLPSPSSPNDPTDPNQPDLIFILLTLIRLDDPAVHADADVLLTVNVPLLPGAYDPSAIDLERARYGPAVERALVLRDRLLATFEVRDWGLFGGGGGDGGEEEEEEEEE